MGTDATGPAATFSRLWRHNRWLTASFVITIVLALVFIIRAGFFFIYWQNHADEPIQGWMTIRYIAKSYRVEPRLVRNAIGVEGTGPERRPLIRIAREDGRPLDAMAKAIVEAVEADRRTRGLGPGIPTESAPAEPGTSEPVPTDRP